MNLLQLIESCETKSGFNASDYRSTWQLFINEGIRTFGNKYPWPGLEDFYQALVPTGARFLTLPHFVDSIVSILNKTAALGVERAGDYDRHFPYAQSQRTGGLIFSYDKLGTVPTLVDPVGYLWIKPTAGADAGSSLYVTGYVANSGASGSPLDQSLKTETVIAGSGPVTLANLFLTIVSISKATDSAGDYFFYDAGNSNKHISFLSRYDSEASFKRLLFMYAAASDTALEIRYRRKIPPLVNNVQAPHPSVDADFVIAQALSAHYRAREDFTKAERMDGRAREFLQDRENKETNFDEPYSRMIPYIEPPDYCK